MEDILLEKKRHSLAHIMVQAQQRLIDPDLKLGVGPAIDNGYYHDFLRSENADKGIIESEENILKITIKEMQKIVKENHDFLFVELPGEKAVEMLELLGQPYTLELCKDLIEKWETKLGVYINTMNLQASERVLWNAKSEYVEKYKKMTSWLSQIFPDLLEWKFVTFVNMCKWPHVENTKEIDPDSFTLDKIAGAYWKWDSNNIMMTRIYGVVFENKEGLKQYQLMMEEAKKRDHRILWKKLGLFAFSENVWLGLPLRLPKWALLFKTIEDFWNKAHMENGYDFVRTPHIWNKKLREISGHRGFYSSSMYPPMEAGQTLEDQKEWKKVEESEQYLLKPMNCPFHVEIYNAEPKSYREFPLRRCETWTVYRFEKKGQLSGLTRVRWFTQDDAHIMCRKDQVEEELQRVVKFILYIYESFGFKKEDVKVYLSLRDPNNTKKYAGNDEGRELTQKVLQKVADDMWLNYTAEEWEAAFYGPKLDFKVKDCLGRERQCSTLQFDFNLPERFDMVFVNDKWEKERPYMLHRALFWSFERFIGVLIEHYAWAFPFRLSPVQVKIIPVADKFVWYADKVYEEMRKNWIRVSIDDSDDSFSKKIRNGELDKVPYLVIVWEKEESENSVSIRSFKTKEQSTVSLSAFIEDKVNENNNRVL